MPLTLSPRKNCVDNRKRCCRAILFGGEGTVFTLRHRADQKTRKVGVAAFANGLKPVLHLALLLCTLGNAFGATEDFNAMRPGDWLAADGRSGTLPPFFTADTGETSFGHSDYPGYMRVVAGQGSDASHALEVGGTDHGNGLWQWEPSMPRDTGIVRFSVQFSLQGKLPAETSGFNRAMFLVGTSAGERETVFLEFRTPPGQSKIAYRNRDNEQDTAKISGLRTDGSWNHVEVELDYNAGTSRARLNGGEWASVNGITDPSNLNAIGLITNGIARYDNFQLKPDGPEPTFVKQTSYFGLDGWRPGTRVNWTDFNADGWTDMIVGGRQLWRNESGRSFSLVGGVEGALWADMDNDGHIDLFGGDRLLRNLGDGRFEELEGAVPHYESQYMGVCLGDWNGDRFVDVYCGDFGGTSRVYRNDQGKKFATVWENYAGKTYGVAACDFDSDFDVDIYVSNYWLMANVLWRNDGSGADFPFADVAAEYGVAGDPGVGQGYGHSMGAGWGDFDNDGHIDLAAINFNHHDGRRGEDSKFFRNLGPADDHHFEDRSDEVNLAWQESMSQPVIGDYDNDGYLDFLVNVVYAGDHPVLYRNHGSTPDRWSFSDVTKVAGLRLAACYVGGFADIDNDGDLDLVVDDQLWINQGNENHWLAVRLIGNGTTVNRAALGCQVEVDVPGLGTLIRQVCGGRGNYTHQDDQKLHFGLGGYGDPVTLKVRWLDGTIESVRTETDRVITVVQDDPSSR